MKRRRALALLGAAGAGSLAGCAGPDPPTAEPPEGFAVFRFRVVNETTEPIDVFVTLESESGETTDDLGIVGLQPGHTDETRAEAFPRETHTVYVPVGQRSAYTWDADDCAELRLTVRFVDADVRGGVTCLREWED